MSKKKRGTLASEPDQALGELVGRALESDPQGNGSSPLLEEVRSLSPNALLQFATSLARQGQEKALPLLEVMATQEDLAEAAIEAFSWVKSEGAAHRLRELSETASSRTVRKAANRGLYRLRSLGVITEASPATSNLAPAAFLSEASKPQAWASALDGLGSRFLFLSVSQPLEGRLLTFLVLNDEKGIQQTRAIHLHKDWEATARVEAMARESRLPQVEVHFDYARHLIREARERTKAAGLALPTEYLVWKELIGEPEESWEQSPIYQELNSAQILLEPRLLEESSRLLDLREFLSWRLETEQMRPYVLDMEQARHGSIVLPETARGERGERVLAKALANLLDAEGRPRYKRRLEEMSYVLLHTGREREAKWALAAALALEQQSRQGRIYLPGSRPTDLALGEAAPLVRHPFFRRLVGESLERAMEEITRSRKVITAG